MTSRSPESPGYEPGKENAPEAPEAREPERNLLQRSARWAGEKLDAYCDFADEHPRVKIADRAFTSGLLWALITQRPEGALAGATAGALYSVVRDNPDLREKLLRGPLRGLKEAFDRRDERDKRENV